MSRHFPHIERAYAASLWLYPASFRESYADAMLQSLRDALADSNLSRLALLRTLLKDLIQSLIKENLAMLRETISRPTLFYNALVLIALCTAICLGFVVIEQQALRQSANDPQLGIATDLAIRLARGISPTVAVPNDKTDMDLSLSPFVIAYDEQGKVLASSAQLNGAVPQLPQGVLDYLDRVRACARIPVCAGFGIRSREQVARLAGHVDGVIVGSALVEVLERNADPTAWLATLRADAR